MLGITYTHRNLRIYEHCECQIDCCKLPKRKHLLVITKSKTQNWIMGNHIQENDYQIGEMWRESIHIGKTQNVKDPVFQIGEIHERFRLRIIFGLLDASWIPNWFSKNIFFIPIHEGRWNATAWGKGDRFWCFLSQEIHNFFFPKWGSAKFEFPHSSNPPLPHPQEKSCPHII